MGKEVHTPTHTYVYEWYKYMCMCSFHDVCRYQRIFIGTGPWRLSIYHLEMGSPVVQRWYTMLTVPQSSVDSSVCMFHLTVVHPGITHLLYCSWLYVGSRLSNSGPRHYTVNVVSTGLFLSGCINLNTLRNNIVEWWIYEYILRVSSL